MWTQIDSIQLDPLLRFLGPREAGCVTFTSQLRRDGSISLPPRRHARVYARVVGGRVTGAVLQNLSGAYFPVLDPTNPTLSLELTDLMTRASRRVYSVMGRTEDVLAFEKILGRGPRQYLEYYLMVQHHVVPERSFPRVPDNMTVRFADARDVANLVDLQRKYEIEEVLLPGNAFHAASSRRHLQETLEKEVVVVGELNGVPIAKVSTNARGIFYDQIGGVFTEPEYRSRGISSVLMTTLLNRISMEGKSGTLFVKRDNMPAIKMYTNLGFTHEDHFRISYYG